MMRALGASALALVVAAVTALAGSPAPASPAADVVWGSSSFADSVQMSISEPDAVEPHLLVRFKRTGGEGRRQVRIAERHYRPATHDLSPWRHSRPRSLAVDAKVVIASRATLPCSPETHNLTVQAQLRVARPGAGWGPWTTWASVTERSRDC